VSPTEVIERERRWATPAALLTIGAVAILAIQLVILARNYNADGNAELLREVNEDSGTLILAYVIRAIGTAMLAIPLAYLFEAALARSDRMRRQFIGLVIAAPIFLGAFAIVTALSLDDAAPKFVAKAAAQHLGTGDHADKVAENVIEDTSLRGLAAGLGFAGTIGFAFAMAYTCFQALRVGLLSRFWGSLGAALAVASIIPTFFQFTLLWLVYLGLLIGGRVPGGRPPAWAAGRAIPWPSPGEQAAESLAKGGDGDEPGPAAGAPHTEPANPPRKPGERRKRKRRRSE
jgi:hypothetical protein